MNLISHLLQSHSSSVLNLNRARAHQGLFSPDFTTLSLSHLQEPLNKPIPTQSPLSPHREDHPARRHRSCAGGERHTTVISSLIKSSSSKTHLLQIHAHILRTSLIQDPSISLAFLSRFAFSPLQDLSFSGKFLSQIEAPTVAQYNAMIRAYSLSDSPEEGFHFYRLMRRRGVHPDAFSSSYIIKSCIKIMSLIGGMQVHARIVIDGHHSDSFLLTSLMDLYSLCKKSVDACNVFVEMPQKDTVARNVLISCCINNNRTKDSFGLFDAMERGLHGCNSKPDDVTCLLLLQACAHVGALEFGERVHAYLEEQGYGAALKLRNSLIAMYSRCGCVDKAYKIFQEMPERNVVSWSAMISGLAMNGHGKEAIEAFLEMKEMGVSPDDQTFTGVLSACSHSGLVDEGMMYFDSMSKEFGMAPNVHHYGCMVDLMGRARMLDQAYQLITSMRVKPDPTIWRTLLGACRNDGNLALGERVIEHLIELKAQEAGDYVLLLNMYSSVGNWEKVAEVRRVMKENQIQTTPGCSTSELRGQLHEFVADDVSHPQAKEIYEMLDEINKQLKMAGYEPEISCELHNLGAAGKGNRLSCHSEKLAIAFGVLSTLPGTKIRVANNLRTCADCHNFARVLSAVYNREVVLRDRSRFHHFHEGRCSCNGYW